MPILADLFGVPLKKVMQRGKDNYVQIPKISIPKVEQFTVVTSPFLSRWELHENNHCPTWLPVVKYVSVSS